MIEWKDVTFYPPDDKVRIPKVFKYVISDGDSVYISVYLHKSLYTEKYWRLNCLILGIDNQILQSEDVKDAKDEAISIVYQKIHQKLDYYSTAINCIVRDLIVYRR